MKKQVILEIAEYEKLVEIAALATQILDRYTLKENDRLTKEGIFAHIVDTERCDRNYSKLFSSLLYSGKDLQNDVIKALPRGYFNTKVGQQSILADDITDF